MGEGFKAQAKQAIINNMALDDRGIITTKVVPRRMRKQRWNAATVALYAEQH